MPVVALPKYVDELKTRTTDNLVTPLVEAPPDATLSKVLGLFLDRGVYQVFFPEGIRCEMISERELLKATNIEATKPSALVSHIPVLRKEALVGEVARLMADYRIRATPISDGRKIVGQVNCTTLLRELRGRIGGDLKITSLATENPITIEEDDTVAKARDILVRKRIDHLPVLKDKRIVGLLTSSHIVSRLKPLERVGSKSIRSGTRSSLDFRVGDAMDMTPLRAPPMLPRS